MNRPVIVLSSPYTGPTPAHIAWNVARASLLSRLLTRMGYAVLPLAPLVHTGCWGDDGDPEQRAAGMEALRRLIRGQFAGGAELRTLLRDDGTMSEGCKGEVAEAKVAGARELTLTWRECRAYCAAHAPDLLAEWDRLAAAVDAITEWDDEFHPASCRWYGLHDDAQTAADVDNNGWMVWMRGADEPFAEGRETGQAGRDAADAALRAAGVLS